MVRPCNALALPWYATGPGWAMGHVRPRQWSWEFAMVRHGMSWLSVTYSWGHTTDDPWPRLDDYALVTHGHP